MFDLKGRVAAISGGALGIGAGVAKELAASGAAIAIGDVNDAAARATVAEIEKAGGKAAAFHLDVTSWDSAFAFVAQAEKTLGPIDILVNNAGVSKRAPFAEMTEEQWDRVLDVNLKGQFLLARAAIPGMIARNYGRIINMSSVCGKQGFPMFAHYCASKFGNIGFTQSLAKEYARTGITVNAVCPGSVETPLHEGIMGDMAAASGLTPEVAHEQFLSWAIPQGRLQTAQDIGRMVAYLASDFGVNMTGGTYHVDGGSVMD